MGIDFDVLKGVLSIDARKWDKGILDATKSLTGLKVKVETVFSEIDRASERLSAGFKRISASTAQLDRVATTLGQTRDRALSLSSGLGALQVPLLQVSQAARRANADLSDTGRQLATIKASSNLAPLAGQVREVESNMGRLSITASSVGDRIGAAFESAWAKVKMGATILAASAAGAGVASVKVSADFEKEMSRVKALMSGSISDDKQLGEAHKLLADQARELGASTVFSSKQAAEGMRFFALAGLDARTIYQAMPATLDLAAAGAIDVKDAADIASKALFGMKIPVEQLGHVMDVLAKASTTANTDVKMIGDGLKYVGPVANAAGMSIEKTVAAIQVLSNAGLQADMAGTGLRGVLSDLASSGSGVKEVYGGLGVEWLNADGAVRQLDHVIDEFNAKLREQGREGEIAGLAMKAFGDRAGPAFLNLASAGGEALRGMTAALEGADGTAKRIAQMNLDNLAGSWTEFGNAVESIALKLGDKLSPSIRSALDWLTKWLNENEALIGQNIDGVIDGIGLAIERTTAFIGPMVETVAAYFETTLLPAVDALIGKLTDAHNWLTENYGESLQAVAEGIGGYFERVGQFWDAVLNSMLDGGLRLKVFFADVMTDIANMMASIVEKTATVMAKVPGMGGLADSMRETASWLKTAGAAYQAITAKQREQIELENRQRQDARRARQEEEGWQKFHAQQDAAEAKRKRASERDAALAKLPQAKPKAAGSTEQPQQQQPAAGGVASIPAEQRQEAAPDTSAGPDLPSSTGFLRGGVEAVQDRFRGASRNTIQSMVGQFATESNDVAGRLAKYRATAEGRKANIGQDVAELERLRSQIIQTMQAAKNASGEARDQQVATLVEIESKYAATYDKISQKVRGVYDDQTKAAKESGDKKAEIAKTTTDKEIAETKRRGDADKQERSEEVANAKQAASEKQAAGQSASAGGSGASMQGGNVTYAGGRRLTNQGNGVSLSAGGTGNGAPIYTDQVGSAMTQIMQMSFGLTNLFNGAVQGIGAGVAQLNEVIASSTPMQKLDLMINDLQAKAGMMMHNTSVTGSMESRRAEVNVQEELDALQRQKNKLWWEEADARSKAEDRARAAKNKPASAPIGGNRGSQADQYGALSVHDAGTTVVQNFHGVTNKDEFVDELQSAIDRKGVARSNKRNRYFSRNDSTFQRQGG